MKTRENAVKFAKIHHPWLWKSIILVGHLLHVGALTELVGGFDETGKNKLPIDYPPFKRSKCYYMLLIFERGCSQLFPGTKILKNDSVAAEKQFDEVRASNIWMH